MIIAGIGSRKTPKAFLDLFEQIGVYARQNGHLIRSGHADGADYAFEKGALTNTLVYLPWKGFNSNLPLLGRSCVKDLEDKYMEIVYRHEPYAKGLGLGVKKIKQRNVFQILGIDLQCFSELVICWTPNGETTGGTGLAIKIAEEIKIPVINLGAKTLSLKEIIEIMEETANGYTPF